MLAEGLEVLAVNIFVGAAMIMCKFRMHNETKTLDKFKFWSDIQIYRSSKAQGGFGAFSMGSSST